MTRPASQQKLFLPGIAACWLIAGCYIGQSARPEAAVARYVEAMAMLDVDYLTVNTCEGANLDLLVSRLDELGAEGRKLFDSLVFVPVSDASTATHEVHEAFFQTTKVTIVVRADLGHCIESLE